MAKKASRKGKATGKMPVFMHTPEMDKMKKKMVGKKMPMEKC